MSTLARALPLAIAAMLLLGIFASCDDAEISNLSAEEIESLHQAADQFAEGGNLKPAMPLYFPEGLERSPCLECEPGKGPDLATMRFIGRDDLIDPEVSGVSLELWQALAQPTSNDGSFSEIDLDGITALQQIEPQSGPGIGNAWFYTLQFRLGDREYFVRMDWPTPDGAFTQDMKEQTERVAKSVIHDARDQGLVAES